MWNRLGIALCASALCVGLAVMPARALETRVVFFGMSCDSTFRTVSFLVGGLGADINRFIQGAELAVHSLPKGGSINSLRLQAMGDPKKTLLVMGSNETRARADYTSSLALVRTNTSGEVAFLAIGSCKGGGTLRAFANIGFFN